MPYADNIDIFHRNPLQDWVFTAAPGIGLGFLDPTERFESFLDRDRWARRAERPEGSFSTVDYAASLIGFTTADSESVANHSVGIDAQRETGKLQVTVGGRLF